MMVDGAEESQLTGPIDVLAPYTCPRCATTSAPASPRPHRRQLPSTGSVRSATSPRCFGPGPGTSPAGPPTRTHQPARARQP
jgi:hypothetical protein